MTRQTHWESVYSTKPANTVSWFQPHADRSSRLIRDTGLPNSASIIDIGGGASMLVDDLLADGYTNLTVLDLSEAALAASRARLGTAQALRVRWMHADITSASLDRHAYALWHDRAAFHFLIDESDRRRYVRSVTEALEAGGHLIVATFAENGPERCSGLPVARYSAGQLSTVFGSAFSLVAEEREQHRTPAGSEQWFQYCHFRKSF